MTVVRPAPDRAVGRLVVERYFRGVLQRVATVCAACIQPTSSAHRFCPWCGVAFTDEVTTVEETVG